MAVSTRPRRSALYIPGSNERALEKAASIPADVIIFDLEDSVAPDVKSQAREAETRQGYVFVFDPKTSTVKKTKVRGQGVQGNLAIIHEGIKAGCTCPTTWRPTPSSGGGGSSGSCAVTTRSTTTRG